MLLDHEKNALCDGYIVELIHDATENYMREEYMLVGVEYYQVSTLSA